MNGKIKKFIGGFTLQTILTISGVVIVLVNLYISSQLAPLVQNINALSSRVSAIEERNVNVDPLIPRFVVVEEKVRQIAEDIKEIKVNIKEIINLLR